MSRDDNEFKKYATEYDPIKIGSVDGTDTEAHDRALTRALSSEYTVNKLVKGDPQYTIFVSRLNPRTTEVSTDCLEFFKKGVKLPVHKGSCTASEREAVVMSLIENYVFLSQYYGPTQSLAHAPPMCTDALGLITEIVNSTNVHEHNDTVKSEFSKFGKISHCRLVKDIVTGKSKQYAFIEFESQGSVQRALREMHQEDIDGARVVVEREAQRRLRGWRPRRLGGGFGGKKESGQLRFGCRDRPWKRPILIQKHVEQFTKDYGHRR